MEVPAFRLAAPSGKRSSGQELAYKRWRRQLTVGIVMETAVVAACGTGFGCELYDDVNVWDVPKHGVVLVSSLAATCIIAGLYIAVGARMLRNGRGNECVMSSMLVILLLGLCTATATCIIAIYLSTGHPLRPGLYGICTAYALLIAHTTIDTITSCLRNLYPCTAAPAAGDPDTRYEVLPSTPQTPPGTPVKNPSFEQCSSPDGFPSEELAEA